MQRTKMQQIIITFVQICFASCILATIALFVSVVDNSAILKEWSLRLFVPSCILGVLVALIGLWIYRKERF